MLHLALIIALGIIIAAFIVNCSDALAMLIYFIGWAMLCCLACVVLFLGIWAISRPPASTEADVHRYVVMKPGWQTNISYPSSSVSSLLKSPP